MSESFESASESGDRLNNALEFLTGLVEGARYELEELA